MPKVGDKVTYHYGRAGEIAPYPATVVSIWPSGSAGSPIALVLDVAFTQDIIDSGINPRQSHSVQTSIDSPESGGWT